MLQSMFSDGIDQVPAKHQSIYFVCLIVFILLWLGGCTVHVGPAGSGLVGGGNAFAGNYATNSNQNQPFNGCARVCNAMGVCTSNPALYPQMARSGATCVGNGHSIIASAQVVQNGNQIYNCKSGGTGTRDQCLARDASATNGNQNQNNAGIYNCKSGGQGTAEVCRARDAESANNAQGFACKSGGRQPTVAACQRQDLQQACSKGNKQACDIQKRI